ncbi:AAA family ATPase [Actinosynnema sp. NPDC023587]|uniref:AAA family ATPase n=1 Tax=Actinosynnema sp. NPDC023587 TaxID=3154695 RepID=UPI0033F9D09F
MGKNHRKMAATRRQPGTARQPTAATPGALPRQAVELAAAEAAAAGELGLPTDVEEPAHTKEVGLPDLRTAYNAALKAQALADRRRRQSEETGDRLTKERESLTAEQAAIREAKAELTAERNELAANRKALDEREATLTALRDEAESGFASLREKRLGRLEEELDNLRASWEERRAGRLAELERKLTEREEVAAARIAKTEFAIEERERRAAEAEAQLATREAEVRRAESKAVAHEQIMRQRETDQRMALEEEYRTDFDRLTHEADGWRLKFEALDELSKQRAAEIARLRAADAVLGERPEQAAEELQRLRLENERLQREVDNATPFDQERYTELARRVEALESERVELVRRNAELKRSAELNRISVADRETNRLVTESLNQRYAVLKTAHDELRLEIDQFQQRKEGQSPFQECILMDADPQLQASPRLPARAPALPDLVHRVRHRIGMRGRYFSEHDVRCFLGGLAMSRLHLLQGISGIGKTSFPRDFAAAIGAECVVAPVAAEWRSPQDLMGYYNPFERRFYESAFTKALYRAQQPLHVNKPFLIVLDEMNLSHPEQYFSDVLHVLELRRSQEREKLALELMTGRVEPAPRLLEDGHKIIIPDNVWFIGTANQDETTVAFADKTYDRAHVTELPARPERFEAEQVSPIDPFSTRGLEDQFAAAQRAHHEEATFVSGFLDELVEFTRDEFGLTAGSRVVRQLERFVPVVVASGGSAAEAADHLIATKLLRKLRGRVEIRGDRLKTLRDHLNAEWGRFGADAWQPEESSALLNAEIRDRGGW